ncbi:alpha/beta hydrolase [Solimonas sp. K1W22B-7]|uniref:alpha/beta hydrolase fold domain-containing protein n=1 Tax=Solimonas sp. K1W22B-7 TaxID=2303331 RepID=UPI000E32E160|nr:alpha/beta hydrolase fold domain-containing protein [Solimonas sp. K1W22B-7]AXQ28691.1 alpha/beta hydrolase [Solimonas sp. K1W22B-7]
MNAPNSAMPASRQPLLPAPVESCVVYRPVPISTRSRIIVWLLKIVLRPWLARMIRGSDEKVAKIQLQVSHMRCPNNHGLTQEYTIVGRVPGHVFGDIADTSKPIILWLHGGAFILPAAPHAHLEMVASLASKIGGVGFLPDYRLAPRNRFPAALDDCERAYGALLELGYPASRIVVGGDSAGGHLLLGLLQRIRKNGWPMPACAIPVSPATEMGRIHSPPSRTWKRHSDPILPIAALQRVDEMFAGDWDASDPELSPLYADCTGFPPMLMLATNNEVLTDDTVLMARRAKAAGVDVKCEIWPLLPHAFPLFASLFPEVKLVRKEMLEYIKAKLDLA